MIGTSPRPDQLNTDSQTFFSTTLHSGGRSSVPIALISTTSHRIPASPSTHQEPERDDLIPLDQISFCIAATRGLVAAMQSRRTAQTRRPGIRRDSLVVAGGDTQTLNDDHKSCSVRSGLRCRLTPVLECGFRIAWTPSWSVIPRKRPISCRYT